MLKYHDVLTPATKQAAALLHQTIEEKQNRFYRDFTNKNSQQLKYSPYDRELTVAFQRVKHLRYLLEPQIIRHLQRPQAAYYSPFIK